MYKNMNHPGLETRSGSPYGPSGVVGGIVAILAGAATYALSMNASLIPFSAILGFLIGALLTSKVLPPPTKRTRKL